MKKIDKNSKGVSIAKFAVGTTAKLGVSYLVGSTAGIIMHVANASRFMKFCGTTGALGLANGAANYASKQWDDMIDVYIDAYNDIVDLTEE